MRNYFLFLIILFFTSCAKYNVETLVQVEYNNTSASTLDDTKSMLKKKLAEAGFSKTKIIPDFKNNQLTVFSNIDKAQNDHFELFRSQLMTPNIGFWNTFRITDDLILGISSDIPKIPSFNPNMFLGGKDIIENLGGKEILGESNNQDSLELIKKQLEQNLIDVKHLKLLWTNHEEYNVSPIETAESPFYLYMINTEGKLKAPLHGGHLKKIATEVDPYTGSPIISMELNEEGTEIFKQMTHKAFIEGNRSIAIVINNTVLSAPSIAGEIPNGKLSISGGFSLSDVNDLKLSIEACMNQPYSIHLISEKIK